MPDSTLTESEPLEVNQESADALSQIYAFLALTMRYPAAEFVDTLFIEAFTSILSSLEWREELDTVNNWLDGCNNLLEDLQLAYTKSFINSSPKATVFPYASVYLDGDGCIQGKSTEAIHDFYRQCGFDVVHSQEPPDHIQHQLEFLAALSKKQRFDEEEDFLTTFFRPWFKQFYSKFNDEARHPFYRVSVQLIDFFTKEEQ